MAVLPSVVPLMFIPLAAIIGITFAVFLWYRVSKVQLTPGQNVVSRTPGREYLLEEEQRGDDEVVQKAADIQEAISVGANSFLFTEYAYMAVFGVVMSVILLLFLGVVTKTASDKYVWMNAFATTISFVVGATTSIASGYLGMKIATYANARTAVEARKGIAPAFMTAFRSGAVMGFLLSSLGVAVLYVLILAYYWWFDVNNFTSEEEKLDAIKRLYESITGYGLGGSSIALFGRVGGGIYTKAADVGADLVGKVEKDIPEDDPRNPAVIADNVGDNVGDIAGMGADLFGSFAESTCAALVVASVSTLAAKDYQYLALSFPVSLSAAGILVCLVTTLVATDWFPAKQVSEIEETLKLQLWISTAAASVVSLGVCKLSLPEDFILKVPGTTEDLTVSAWSIWICVLVGLWGGLFIGLQTEYFTSNRFQPVKDVSDACKTGAATNIIFGLALGYKSAIIPAFCIAINIYIGNHFAGMLGVACAALGMLNTLATGLAIDAYGPISDNAGGIAEMAGMGEDIRERTDALDAAGNTTAAIGKGFAIGSAALVSLALFGAFITRSGLDLTQTSILDPRVFAGLLIGAMLPYWFSAMTMKSVGKAALAMVHEVRHQFSNIPGLLEGTARPDYKRCVEISTRASLTEMIPPGFLVMASPLIVGALFGTQCLAGLLAGGLVSGVQLAISMSNTGGAWDNAKKYIEAGASEHARELGGKGSDCHKAAVIGDTVGDPLKDTSGPSLNILVKLMAVESLVFAPFFLACNGGHGWLFGWLGGQ